MKKAQFTLTRGIFLLFCSLFCILYAEAQTPQKYNYQAVARDISGNLIANTQIGLRISIRQASASGTIVYQETHLPTTNQFGLFSLEIGTGTIISGTFNNIAWGNNTYFQQVELDPNGSIGGLSYTNMGSTQLLSVPYALYAKDAGTAPPDADSNPNNEIQTLNLSGNNLSLSNGGGSVALPTGTTYIAGTGINISGNTISNIGDSDNNSSNEIQTLSLSGNNLSLSNGGGSVTLPSSGGGSGWNLTGNAATNPSTNFIGTTDDQPLLFRVNNQKAGTLNTGNTAFGMNAMNNNTIGVTTQQMVETHYIQILTEITI
ncbi:MAG: hypothetical protein IPL33_08160 [Sphingobacteriales bacterium]|nr:hypothetical protein [Sphingobacteriales bacterium]